MLKAPPRWNQDSGVCCPFIVLFVPWKWSLALLPLIGQCMSPSTWLHRTGRLLILKNKKHNEEYTKIPTIMAQICFRVSVFPPDLAPGHIFSGAG